MLGVTGSGPRFRKHEKLSEGRIVMFRFTRSNKFPRCWVMVSLGCSEKNPVPPVTREVTATHSLWIGFPHVCPAFVLFPVVIAYVSVHLSLVIEMRVYFVSSGLKEYGLSTQSLGLNCPLSEVRTPPPHNSGMTYGPVTENNNNPVQTRKLRT